ncbi:MAG: class I SAM-dependent methyltransferase [Nitratireductor sp.]
MMIRDAGFSRVDFNNMTGGVAALAFGWKFVGFVGWDRFAHFFRLRACGSGTRP